MENESGLELSLGLGLGGSLLKSKSKSGDAQKPDSSSESPVKDSGTHHETDGVMNLNIVRPVGVSKRKIPFDDVNNQKKHEKDAKTSHISIADDDSTAEIEDVADSEVGRCISKGPTNPGNLNYGVQFPVQLANAVNSAFPFHVKGSSSVGASSNIQVISASSGEQRMENYSVNPGNSSVVFGYSPVQLPTLDEENAWGFVSHLQQYQPLIASRGPTDTATQIVGQNASKSTQHKQHIVEEGSTSQREDDAKGIMTNLGAKDTTEQSTADGFSTDLLAIRPGIATEIKFGGSGSYPNLPWVSTTAPGPNGRTISGVTYRSSASQIRIVCACHGSHMPPEDFVRHAAEDISDTGNGLAAFPSSNPAASAQS